MIRLRPYKPSDAWELLKWWDGRTEEEFVKWSAGAFTYPLTIEQLDAYFETWCLKEGGGWPVMALDASEAVPVAADAAEDLLCPACGDLLRPVGIGDELAAHGGAVDPALL